MIDGLLLAGRRFYQVLRASQLLLGISVLGFELRDIRFVGVDLRLKRRLLEEVEEIALFDLGAFDEQALFEIGADPGDERHPSDGLNAADEFVGLRDLLPLGAHHPDRGRAAGRGLGAGGNRKRDYD